MIIGSQIAGPVLREELQYACRITFREVRMQNRFTTITEDRKFEIPREMLECLGLKPGDAVDLCIRDGLLSLAGPVSVVERSAGALKPPPGMILPSAEEMRRMAEEAIAEDALRRMGGR